MRKLNKQQLKRIIREEKRKLNEGYMGEMWSECMNNLMEMALDNNWVCALCASQAIDQAGQGPATMDICLQLIQDLIDEGSLKPVPHPSHKGITVYAAQDPGY